MDTDKNSTNHLDSSNSSEIDFQEITITSSVNLYDKRAAGRRKKGLFFLDRHSSDWSISELKRS